MPIDTDKFKNFTENLGLQIDYSDGQVLLTAFKEFGAQKTKQLSQTELTTLRKAYKIIKAIADKEHEEFWNRYQQQLSLNL
jgi:hypothetical protein